MDMNDLYEDDLRPWNVGRYFDLVDGHSPSPGLGFFDPADVDGARQMAMDLQDLGGDGYVGRFSDFAEDHGVVEDEFFECEPIYAVSDVVDPENPDDIAAMRSVVDEVEPHVPRSTLGDFTEAAMFDEFADSDYEENIMDDMRSGETF